MPSQELDVRSLRKPDKHPAVFAAFDALGVGESLTLLNDHDPVHLHSEFMVEHQGSHAWAYLETGPKSWRVQLTRLASTALPHQVCDIADVLEGADTGAAGALWRLPMGTRDLDANLIQIPPLGTVDAHAGPDLDVLLHVVGGSGRLTTEVDPVQLHVGMLVWLPRRSLRGFNAGGDGLQYVTVHQRRVGLPLTAAT